MKHVKLIYWVIVFAGLFFSCYEDHSSLTYKLINPINIELGDESTEYTVFAYDTLEIKPIVYREGVEDADLSFRWTISGDAVPPTVLDTNMTFKAQIALTPSATAYDLLLEVYDKTTGIEVEQAFKVNVESPFGAGLIISETEDDIVSDVSLIRAYNFSSNFKQDQDTVMRNLFSLVNGRKIAGVGTAILSTKYGVYGQYLTIGTSTSIDRVDPYDYEYIDGNGDSFMIDPKDYNVTSLGFSSNAGCIETIVIGGKLYTHYYQTKAIHTFSYYLLTSDLSDYRVGLSTQPEWAYGLCFDEMNGRFLEIHGRDYLRVLDSKKLEPDAPFDPNKLQNFTCRAMFSGRNDVTHNILQEKDPATGKPLPNGKIYCYDTQQEYYYDDEDLINGMPSKIIDLNAYPEIQNALFFSGTNNRDYIYYATEDKVYTIDLTLQKATADYTVPRTEASDEVITSMAVWLGNGMMNYTNNRGEMGTTGSSNNMLVVTTYSPSLKEGFVRSLPISTTSGHIEPNADYHGMWRGFGKITATCAQKN